MPILDPVFREQLRAKRQPKILLGGKKRERDRATRLRENEFARPPYEREVMKVEEQPGEVFQDATATDSLHAVANQSNGSSAEIESPAFAPLVRQEDCRPAAWWPRFIGPTVRQVSREDALDCVRLVLTELRGEEKAREAQIQMEGQVVRLSRLYAELKRLTGNPACWGIVQTLMLQARQREGIQPLASVPLPTRSSDGTTFPWIGEDNGLRRELEREGCWPG
jgi:hypothetical protein